jgi:hypothetical protein
MPNIEIIGFENPQVIRAKIEELIRKSMCKVVENAITTIRDESSAQDFNGKSKPYIRVSSTDKTHQDLVAAFINVELGLDVEWLHLDGFFEGKQSPEKD